METPKSGEYRRAIDEQIWRIKAYADGFELFLPKDEAALGEISDALAAVAGRIAELDEARIKRRRLMGELSRAYGELEESQKRFVENITEKVL